MSFQILLNYTAWWRNSRAPNIQGGQKRSRNNNVVEHGPSEGGRNNALKGLETNSFGFRKVVEIENAQENTHENQERLVIFTEPTANNNKPGTNKDIWEEDPHLYAKWIGERLKDPVLLNFHSFKLDFDTLVIPIYSLKIFILTPCFNGI